MNKKIRIILVGFFLLLFIVQLFLFIYFSEIRHNDNQGMSIRGAHIAFLMADGYSESDLQGMKQYFDRWNGRVSILGLSDILSSGESSVNSDIILSDLDDVTVFDSIFIPGGNTVQVLITNENVIHFLAYVNNFGILIAAIGNGSLVQAQAGLLNGRKFTSHASIVNNLTSAGGIYVEGASVVTDGSIITASPSNHEELSYAIANALGYSYNLDVDISFEKEELGWNYSIFVEPSDKRIIDCMILNLSLVASNGNKELVDIIELVKNGDGFYTGNLGVLKNGHYVVSIRAESIFDNIEIHSDIRKFSVGSN